MPLILTPNLADVDGAYEDLLRAHADLSKEESDAFNARLILIFMNHIGDRGVLAEALIAARSQD
jgi:putative Ca2+/H+ antiporter (TMEM165/GDT1 family)